MSIRPLLPFLPGTLLICSLYGSVTKVTRHAFAAPGPQIFWLLLVLAFLIPPWAVRRLPALLALIVAPLLVWWSTSVALLLVSMAFKWKGLPPTRPCAAFVWYCNGYLWALWNPFVWVVIPVAVLLTLALLTWSRWGYLTFQRIASAIRAGTAKTKRKTGASSPQE